MKTPPAVGNSPLRSELELLRPITPGRENWVISLVRTLEEGSPGEVRLLVRKLDPIWWEEELAAAAKAKVEVDGPQAIDRILETYVYTINIHTQKQNHKNAHSQKEKEAQIYSGRVTAGALAHLATAMNKFIARNVAFAWFFSIPASPDPFPDFSIQTWKAWGWYELHTFYNSNTCSGRLNYM